MKPYKHDKDLGLAAALKILGNRWTILILRELSTGKKRFSIIQRSLRGISPRTLSSRLKMLEKEGIIEREIYAEVPPRVEYKLTAKGGKLPGIIMKMREWGEGFTG